MGWSSKMYSCQSLLFVEFNILTICWERSIFPFFLCTYVGRRHWFSDISHFSLTAYSDPSIQVDKYNAFKPHWFTINKLCCNKKKGSWQDISRQFVCFAGVVPRRRARWVIQSLCGFSYLRRTRNTLPGQLAIMWLKRHWKRWLSAD